MTLAPGKEPQAAVGRDAGGEGGMMTTATKSVEKPILFSGEMVRAILDGRKTQTRRVCKKQPPPMLRNDKSAWSAERGWHVTDGDIWATLGKSPCDVGDRLWVRETWTYSHECEHFNHLHDGRNFIYRASDETCCPNKWRPSIHMPRWACRRVLEVTGVRVERLQGIGGADAQREGIEDYAKRHDLDGYWTTAFARLWDELNAKPGFTWHANPWVWVISFKRAEVAHA